MARSFIALDHHFPSILSSTFPIWMFQHAAPTGRLSNTLDISTLSTIWDSLPAAGVSCRYYIGLSIHARRAWSRPGNLFLRMLQIPPRDSLKTSQKELITVTPGERSFGI
jgi:hypothetical protein